MTDEDATSVEERSPREVADAMADGGTVLVDVREADEWEAGHAADAVHIPLAQVDARLPELAAEARGRALAFICRSGSRSGKAAASAASGDGPEIVNVLGGTLAWQEAGLPMVPRDGHVLDPRKAG